MEKKKRTPKVTKKKVDEIKEKMIDLFWLFWIGFIITFVAVTVLVVLGIFSETGESVFLDNFYVVLFIAPIIGGVVFVIAHEVYCFWYNKLPDW